MADNTQPEAGQDRPADAGDGTGDNESTFEPTMPQVNNSRTQGLGVGQKEIDYQRDPTRPDSTEHYGSKQ
jgi:hypothetical protein